MRPLAWESAWSLTDGGSYAVAADGQAAGGAVVTLLVDDLDAWVAAIGDGLQPSRLEEVDGVPRQAIYADPAGNEVALAHLEAAG